MAFRQYDVKPTFGSNPTLLNNDVPDENRGPAMLAWCTVLTSMALFTVMARAFVLGTMSRVAGYDDATIVVSMVRKPIPPSYVNVLTKIRFSRSLPLE